MSMLGRGQDEADVDSADLLVRPEDEVALLLYLSTTGYIEIEQNIHRFTLLFWMNRLC